MCSEKKSAMFLVALYNDLETVVTFGLCCHHQKEMKRSKRKKSSMIHSAISIGCDFLLILKTRDRFTFVRTCIQKNWLRDNIDKYNDHFRPRPWQAEWIKKKKRKKMSRCKCQRKVPNHVGNKTVWDEEIKLYSTWNRKFKLKLSSSFCWNWQCKNVFCRQRNNCAKICMRWKW